MSNISAEDYADCFNMLLDATDGLPSGAELLVAKSRMSVADERLAVQRDILARRREAAAQAWRAEFIDLLRRKQHRIENEVASIRASIVKKLDGNALNLLRESLAVAVHLKLGASGLMGLVPPF